MQLIRFNRWLAALYLLLLLLVVASFMWVSHLASRQQHAAERQVYATEQAQRFLTATANLTRDVRAFVVTGDAEVQADGLSVADMEITVRLRRKTGMHALVLTAGQIFIDDLTDKVGWAARLAHGSPQKCVTGGSCAGWHPHHPAVKPDMIPHYAPCLNLNLANPGHWRAKNGKQREPL